jgi:hypothetical protein
MTQTMDLKKMGLTPMSNFEMVEVDGGVTNWWGVAALVLGVAVIIVTDGAATPALLGMGRALGALSFLSTMDAS